MFRIIFVLDLLNGKAVHAVRGERSKYLPVQSKVCNSSNPLDIVSGLKPKEAYIADLDRLQHLGDNFEIIKRISAKTKTMADIGAENMDDVKECAGIAETVILGTETASLELIQEAAERFPGGIDVSIDIKNSEVLTKDENMMIKPGELVEILNRCNIRDIIILELGRVGTGAGVDTDFLRDMVGLSDHSVLLGGGVRDMNDIDALEEIGISGALVATAVHNGRIPAQLLR
ncbi:MAG: HisA/HisF-related TIM barrel protein [Candidatus Methanoperedens sp.]|nr:HisA/HisF-related TIM barrel protein [Candidatus Methanoperedens sp.]